ncbi:MAG: hypothetical protein KIT72_01625 [Polyangiaceae bacterium]|nr:hypothetical protein [Polyangiaceae bacterium]MCW5789097.1 hypothetical protein [Polyangiaceae bacterium]
MTASFALTACGEDAVAEEGIGEVSFNVYGEEYIEEGIPTEEFEDGFSAVFDQFLIVVGDVEVKDSSGASGGALSGSWLLDLVKPGPHEIGSTGKISARSYDQVGYETPAYSASTGLHSSATESDAALMAAGGYSVYVSGSATRGGVTKIFKWGFTGGTHYGECTQVDSSGEVVRQGLVLANGGILPVQLTIHGDHFFYDDLAAETAVLRFDAIANADTNDDGEVTREELAAVRLSELSEGSYGTGGMTGINTLDQFIAALVSTLGHYRGEGHCHAHQLP